MGAFGSYFKSVKENPVAHGVSLVGGALIENKFHVVDKGRACIRNHTPLGRVIRKYEENRNQQELTTQLMERLSDQLNQK